MSELKFDREHPFNHTEAAERIEARLREMAQESGTEVSEEKTHDGARRITFAGDSFSGAATIGAGGTGTEIVLGLKVSKVVTISIEDALLQVEDKRVFVSGDVPWVWKGKIKKTLAGFLDDALTT